MKKIIIVVLAVSLLLTGCKDEVKKSKNESKKIVQSIKQVKKKPLSEDESIYMKTIQNFVNTFSKSVNGVQKHIEQASKDASIANNKEWRDEIYGNFVAVATMANVMESMTNDDAVPERFLALHSNAYQCFKLMGEAGQKLMYAINNDNSESFNESMQLMAKSNLKLNKVNKELNKIRKEVK